MRYFTYIAEQSFKTSETGERLFYLGGPWKRPYIIPDAETEDRLYWKQVWMLRFTLGSMIVGQPFLFLLYPQIMSEPYWFVVYLVAVMAITWVISRIIFARDLSRLERAPAPLKQHSFYSQMAQKHSRRALSLGFLGSLAFVVGGIWIWSAKGNLAVAVTSIVLFGLCAFAWGYALLLKMQSGISSAEPETAQQS